MDMTERGFVSELRKQALSQFIVAALTAGIAAPKAEVTAEADYQGQTRVGRLFPASRRRGGRDRRALRGGAQDLLQRSQGRAIARPNTARWTFSRSSRRRSPIRPRSATPTPRRLTRRSPARTRGSARPRSATCSRSCSPTTPTRARPRPSSRPGRASTTSSRSAASSREDTDLGETTKDAMLDKAEADAVFALPQGGVSEVVEEPVRSGDRPRQGRHALDDETVRGGRRRGQASGLGFPRRRQDPGAP